MNDSPILTADGFDDAFLGVAYRDDVFVAVYSRDKIIDILMQRDGMTEEDASDYFEFNIEGAYVGPQTPIYVEQMSLEFLRGDMQ
jgi:hypothetical protein